MAITTSNMGLTAWSSLTDFFNHTQLSANFVAIDEHDHTTGKGVAIPASGIAALAIATSKIADGAVTNPKLATNAVATANITDLNVTTGKLAAGAVTYDKVGSLPGARVYSSSAFSVPSAANTPISFNTARFNNSTSWVVGSPTRLTAPVTGVYAITGHVHFASSAAGNFRSLNIRYNGSNRIAGHDRAPTTTANRYQSVAAIYKLNATDYVELCYHQDSGGALNLEVTEQASPEFAMMWLSA